MLSSVLSALIPVYLKFISTVCRQVGKRTVLVLISCISNKKNSVSSYLVETT